jgi:N-acetylglucosamine kinase-like BadF-type ATPase
MIFIIESGSTKSDWVLVNNKSKQTFYNTIGFNPYFHSADVVSAEIMKSKEITSHAPNIKKIFFYGAGCSSEKMNNEIKKGIQSVFKEAEVFVEHDLLACAYATYDGEPGISCIIGTGSNSCYFDGENLTEEVPALGYVLGDEGSGSYFGKFLLSSFLYGKLPSDLLKDFQNTYALTEADIVSRVYQKESANVYIASFMPFIVKHKKHAFFNEILIKGLQHFMEVHVCCYKDYLETPVHFVGSLSALLEDELRLAADNLGIEIRSIVAKPVENLVDYHFKYILKNQLA